MDPSPLRGRAAALNAAAFYGGTGITVHLVAMGTIIGLGAAGAGMRWRSLRPEDCGRDRSSVVRLRDLADCRCDRRRHLAGAPLHPVVRRR